VGRIRVVLAPNHPLAEHLIPDWQLLGEPLNVVTEFLVGILAKQETHFRLKLDVTRDP
jgi:hypothetical protein